MKRLLIAAIAASVLGACHFHSRSWAAQHANDKAPTKVVSDTQPIVKQAGEARTDSAGAPQPAPHKLRAWDRASSSAPMERSTFFTTDSRSVGRFLMANDVDISFAKVAYANAGNEEVKASARRMITDHTGIIETIRTLSSEQDIPPADDDAGRDLRELSTLQRDTLRALTGRAFDEAYVMMELERHRAILAMIDDVLLPRARSSELRELLASTRPIIAAHIAHAEQLATTLSKR